MSEKRQSRTERMFGARDTWPDQQRGDGTPPRPAPEPPRPKSAAPKTPKPVRHPDTQTLVQHREPARTQDDPAPAKSEGYKGFLLLECEECGSVRAFCAKYPVTEYRCRECGHKTALIEDLHAAHVNCKCGKHFKYRTNSWAETIPTKCLACGSPVDLILNRRGTTHVTLGDTEHHGGQRHD